jgi:hypothetical protein
MMWDVDAMCCKNVAGTLRFVPAALLVLVVLGPAGCSVSESVKGSSDSAGASSDSSTSLSRSSSRGGEETQYRDDVREYTAAYLRTGGQFDAFQRGIGDLARKHNITNWEESMVTYEGVGEGLAQGKATNVQLKAYLDGFAGQDPGKRAAMQKGYDSKKR